MDTLTVNDLKIGMHVTGKQISNIYGTWIYVNPETKTDNEFDILYFCNTIDKDENVLKKIKDEYGKLSVIYQNPVYEDEDAEIYD